MPGVADVVTFGGLVKQYQAEIDPLDLEKHKLTPSQLASAVKENNRNAGGALLEMGQQAMGIRGVGLIQSLQDIEDIVVDAANGVPVFIRDVARVKVGAAPQTGILGLNERSGLVEGIVLMRRWENPSQVIEAIHGGVDEINTTRLPPGVRLVPIDDRTELVNNTLRTVARTPAEGLLVVVTVLMLFLVSAKAAFLTALTIPLALLFAFAWMYLTGVSANLLSFGALDLGIIVDGTLAMVERILR